MVGGCAWREHDGKRYLEVVYGTDAAANSEVTATMMSLVDAEPTGSVVRMLLDVRAAPMTGWASSDLTHGRRSVVDFTARFTLRTAVVGVRGPMAALMRGMSMITSAYKIVACPTPEKAVEYLTRQ